MPTRFKDIRFGGIKKDATAALLKSRELINHIEFTSEALHRVYTLSNGHPLFIRIIGDHIVSSNIEGPIKSTNIDTVFQEVLIDCNVYLETDYSKDTNEFHRRILNKLAENTDITYDELRECRPSELHAAEFSQYYRDLMQMGLIIPDETLGNKKPHFANEFLKAYIQNLIGLKHQLNKI